MWNKEKMERTMEKNQDCDPVHQIIYLFFLMLHLFSFI